MEWANLLEHNLNDLYKNDKRLNEFKHLKSNYDRVCYLIENEYYIKQVDFFLNSLKKDQVKLSEEKSLELSETYRTKGNEFYAKSKNKQAFNYYTLALLYAPYEETTNKATFKFNRPFLLAYSNRSAVFYAEKLYEQCLVDIGSVKTELFGLEKFEIKDIMDVLSLTMKLLGREANCYFSLAQFDKLNELNNEINNPTNHTFALIAKKYIKMDNMETKLDKLKETIKSLIDKADSQNNSSKISPICKPNEAKTEISSCVELKYSDSKGRYCIASRDVDVGETLFTEKSYCAILLPEFNNHYCQSCLRLVFNENEENFNYLNIEPCSGCTSVVYCSQKCKLESNYHKFECHILKCLLHNLGIAHLAYRIVSTTSLSTLKEYASLELSKKARLNETDLMKFDYGKSGDEKTDYNQVFNLLTHEESTHVDDLFKYSLTSVLLGKHFVSVLKSSNKDEHKMASCLILRHLLQTICNAHAITQLRDTDVLTNTLNREQIRVATAIYPRVSLLNHSCNSNVLSSFKENSSIIVVKSARKIEKSAEVYNCYGPHYLKMGLFERQQSLLEQYYFNCDCNSCASQFKAISEKMNKNVNSGLRCIKCGSKQVITELIDFNANKNINKFDDDLKINCKSCNKTFNYKDYLSLFKKIEIELSEINFNQINNRSMVKLNELLNNYRNYLLINQDYSLNDDAKSVDEYFKTFYMSYSKLIDALCRVYCNLSKFEVASDLGEKNIEYIRFIYGDTSSNVELAHELFKLAEIQCSSNKFEKALKNVNEAISIARNVYSTDSKIIREFNQLKKDIHSILKC